jgi:transposase
MPTCLIFSINYTIPFAGPPERLESSLQIKKAGGLQRGKTDSIDAQRIAEYAFRFRDQLRLWTPPRAVVQQLAMLSAARQRLIGVYNQLAGPLIEQQSFVSPFMQKQLAKTGPPGGCKTSLTAIENDRKAIDKAIDRLIEGDQQLKQLFALMTSIPGIGTATATEVVIATNELQTITDPKKMACHAGVAPFNYQSGSSVRGRPGVSQHARKRLNRDAGAFSFSFSRAACAGRCQPSALREIYKTIMAPAARQRKVKEGKNKIRSADAAGSQCSS